jgi:hypothetical protein
MEKEGPYAGFTGPSMCKPHWIVNVGSEKYLGSLVSRSRVHNAPADHIGEYTDNSPELVEGEIVLPGRHAPSHIIKRIRPRPQTAPFFRRVSPSTNQFHEQTSGSIPMEMDSPELA